MSYCVEWDVKLSSLNCWSMWKKGNATAERQQIQHLLELILSVMKKQQRDWKLLFKSVYDTDIDIAAVHEHRLVVGSKWES